VTVATGPHIVRSLNDLRQHCAEDFCTFVGYAADHYGYERIPDAHYKIADWLQGGFPPNPMFISRTKAVYGFRYLAKTTLITRWWSMWRWLRCPHMQGKVHSSTDPNAKAMARSIRKGLNELPIMQHLAPDPGEGVYEFNLKGIEPEHGYSMACAGIKTSLTSSRADFYIFDDPEPDDDPESMHVRIIKAMMEAKHILHRPDRWLKHFGTKTLPVPERTQLIVVGQPHCETTCYFPETTDIGGLDEGDGHPLDDAKYLIVPVIDSDGNWTWPEQMEAKYYNYEEGRPQTLAEVRKQFTTRNWELQMMINPQYAATKGAMLRLDEIEEKLRIVENPVVAIDPADSNVDGCEWGVAIGGLCFGKNGHQIHVNYLGGFTGEVYEGDTEDWSISESVWRQIFDIADEFGAVTVLLEKNFKGAVRACERYHRKAGRSGTVEEIPATMNKTRRIVRALDQPINNGMVSMDPSVLKNRMNRRQLSRLQHKKLPIPCDRLDALALLFDYLLEGSELTNPHEHGQRVDVLQFPTNMENATGVGGYRLGDPI
jgi:hypothetical protein